MPGCCLRMARYSSSVDRCAPEARNSSRITSRCRVDFNPCRVRYSLKACLLSIARPLLKLNFNLSESSSGSQGGFFPLIFGRDHRSVIGNKQSLPFSPGKNMYLRSEDEI